MSGTRHAKPGEPLRQERYASSFEKGLLANLVAKRVALLPKFADREIVWFLQALSWQRGEIDRVATQIKASVNELTRLCVDPDYWPAETAAAVSKYRREWLKTPINRVQTETGEKIADALDYTARFKCLTVIDGPARIGKTFETRAWCQRSAGLARYVQVPCSSDEISFYRTIATALGVSASLQLKAAEMRARIEDTLICPDITIVFDEAHYLWPTHWQRYAMPYRVNWIMTALVNKGVPVALVTTPQFASTQKKVEKLTGWNSTQFIGRIGHIERLPNRLEKRDVIAVAKSLLPEGDAAIWRALAAYAAVKGCNLQTIDANIKRAKWVAEKDGRTVVTRSDMRRVFAEITSDTESRTIELSRGVRATLPPGVRLGVADRETNFASQGATVPMLEET